MKEPCPICKKYKTEFKPGGITTEWWFCHICKKFFQIPLIFKKKWKTSKKKKGKSK